MQNAEYIEAKKGMLKSLANKMYQREVEAWKKGQGPKPDAVPTEMKETKAEIKKTEKEKPKVSKHVKDMVQGFFKQKEEPRKDVQMAGFVRRQDPSPIRDAPKRKRRRAKTKD